MSARRGPPGAVLPALLLAVLAGPAHPAEPLPRRLDAATAVSPVYPITSPHCRRHDGEGGEGEDFLRRCKGFGPYVLRASGFDYRVNYGVESTDPQRSFSVMLFPLEDGPAGPYARADRYDEALVGPLEWRLDARGRPFAVVARAVFYKNTGSARTFANPKNKKAEFLLVRGLADLPDLRVDVPTAGTAFNPVEQARAIAQTALDQRAPNRRAR